LEISVLFFGFLIVDWILIAALMPAGYSYGPAKPTVLLLAALRLPFALLPLPAALILQAIGTILVIYAFWFEPHRLTVTHQKLTSSKLPPGFSLRLLHLGDMHVERITAREKQLLQQIQSLKPDLILFSGDVLNLSYVEDPLAIQHARQIIAEWKAPLGTFGVSGSEAVDLAHIFPDLIDGLPMHWIKNETIHLQKDQIPFSVTGLICSHRPFVDAPILAGLAEDAVQNFAILLYHSPDLAPNAAPMGFDLQLSGHTHGGQVCLPIYGPPFTASLYGRRFRSGRYLLSNMVLYITRGIGLEGKAAPRVRFLCPPEIILWEINGTQL
jgi:predicted MPP superfamily phosphohydrolase